MSLFGTFIACSDNESEITEKNDIDLIDTLIWNTKLEQAAINHSRDMFENDFFNHESSDGSTLANRLKEVEYFYSAAGENIASGYTSEQACN